MSKAYKVDYGCSGLARTLIGKESRRAELDLILHFDVRKDFTPCIYLSSQSYVSIQISVTSLLVTCTLYALHTGKLYLTAQPHHSVLEFPTPDLLFQLSLCLSVDD